MRPSKFSVIVVYIMAVTAAVLYVAAWFHVGDLQHATWLVVQACFLLLLSIWAHVCS